MFVLFYFLVSTIWLSVFIAYMQANKGDRNLWEKFYDDFVWKDQHIALCIVGAFFWPLAILGVCIYKPALKFFNRSK